MLNAIRTLCLTLLLAGTAQAFEFQNFDVVIVGGTPGGITAAIGAARMGKTVVLCVDEAQTAPLESLEALRLLSNLETEKRKLLHVVLFGQPELNQKLADPAVRQLLQRIAFHYHLPSLPPHELACYVEHRLKVSGYCGAQLFTAGAMRRLVKYSKGIPRLVNILANKSLLAAYGEGVSQITAQHVIAAARDTEGVKLKPWWSPI